MAGFARESTALEGAYGDRGELFTASKWRVTGHISRRAGLSYKGGVSYFLGAEGSTVIAFQVVGGKKEYRNLDYEKRRIPPKAKMVVQGQSGGIQGKKPNTRIHGREVYSRGALEKKKNENEKRKKALSLKATRNLEGSTASESIRQAEARTV